MSGSTSTAEGVSLPPREAIAFLRGKTNTPTQGWSDVWEGAHTRSFMVAGAASDALLADFRTAVAQALEQGMTLAEFRRDFDGIVARHGWAHTGTPGWRAQIIYETNLSMAYAAGRHAQMTEPGTLAVFPYWQYVHSGAADPRPEHLAWNGLTLRADDPWWKTHYPPNGWKCGCRVRPLSARDLARQGKSGADQAPRVATRPWVRPSDGQVVHVPEGIDPGFGYNVGEAWRGMPPIPGAARWQPPAGWMPPVPRGAVPPDGTILQPATPEVVWRFLLRPQGGDLLLGRADAATRLTLGTGASEIRLSAETARKQRERHPELTLDDYAALLRTIADPSVVLEQGGRRVALLRRDGRVYTAAVKATEDRARLYLLSFRIARAADVARLLRVWRIVAGDPQDVAE